MGAGARTAEAERIESTLTEAVGFDVSDLLEAYGDGGGNDLERAAIKLGKANVEKLVKVLGDEDFLERVEEECDVVELPWWLGEQLENILGLPGTDAAVLTHPDMRDTRGLLDMPKEMALALLDTEE